MSSLNSKIKKVDNRDENSAESIAKLNTRDNTQINSEGMKV